MRRPSRASRTIAVVVSAWTVVPHSTAPILAQATAAPKTGTQAAAPPKTGTQATAPPKTATPAAAASKTAAPAAAREIDGGWPRDYVTASGGAVRVFQPQVASWDGQRRMVAYAAVSYTAEECDEARTRHGQDSKRKRRWPSTSGSSISAKRQAHRVALPRPAERATQEVVAAIQPTVPQAALVIALDRVLARLDKSQIMPKNVEGVKADPPAIFYSTSPAMLVNLDGEPVWSPIKKNDLGSRSTRTGTCSSTDPARRSISGTATAGSARPTIKGPWKAAGKLPGSFTQLPADDNWKDVKAALPGQPLAAPPKVFVSTTPAEMILLTGAPNYLAVTGTQLLWVSQHRERRLPARQGRPGVLPRVRPLVQFAGFTGPWTFATPTLPEDFKKIPLSHERSRVLASVPGTDAGGRSGAAGADPADRAR